MNKLRQILRNFVANSETDSLKADLAIASARIARLETAYADLLELQANINTALADFAATNVAFRYKPAQLWEIRDIADVDAAADAVE